MSRSTSRNRRTPGGQDLAAAVGRGRDLLQGGRAADVVQRPQRAGAHLAALADRHHAELALVLGQLLEVGDQLPVARLEDVQRQHQARHQDGAEGEERESLRHRPRLWRPVGCAAGSTTPARPPGSRAQPRLAAVISRIDLRGRALDPVTLRAVLPRAELDVEAALAAVQPICERVRTGGATALRDLGEQFDGVRPAELRVPAAALAAALDGLDPVVRAALEESIRRARLVHRAQRRTRRRDPGRAGRQRHRALGAGRAGRALRARWAGGLPEQRRDERRARPGGRRRLAGGRLAAAAGQPHGVRRAAQPDHPRGVRAARGRGGLRGRRGAGDRDVRLRRARDRRPRSRRDPLCPGRSGHRPGQHLRRRGQAGAQGADRHRRRGRPDRDRRSWPTTRPRRCTSPPT